MDLATLLMRIDERRYPTASTWLADLDLIVTATHQVLAFWRVSADLCRQWSVQQMPDALHERTDHDIERLSSCLCKCKLPDWNV